MFSVSIWLLCKNTLREHFSVESHHTGKAWALIRLIEACLIIDGHVYSGMEGGTGLELWGVPWLGLLPMGSTGSPIARGECSILSRGRWLSLPPP